MDGDVFSDTTADLAQPTDVVETDRCDLGDVLLHRQLTVEKNANVTYDVCWLDHRFSADSLRAVL
jgi:hypothetical protein